MGQLRRLLQAADDFQRRHRWLAFPVAVAKKYGEDQAGQRAEVSFGDTDDGAGRLDRSG